MSLGRKKAQGSKQPALNDAVPLAFLLGGGGYTPVPEAQRYQSLLPGFRFEPRQGNRGGEDGRPTRFEELARRQGGGGVAGGGGGGLKLDRNTRADIAAGVVAQREFERGLALQSGYSASQVVSMPGHSHGRAPGRPPRTVPRPPPASGAHSGGGGGGGKHRRPLTGVVAAEAIRAASSSMARISTARPDLDVCRGRLVYRHHPARWGLSQRPAKLNNWEDAEAGATAGAAAGAAAGADAEAAAARTAAPAPAPAPAAAAAAAAVPGGAIAAAQSLGGGGGDGRPAKPRPGSSRLATRNAARKAREQYKMGQGFGLPSFTTPDDPRSKVALIRVKQAGKMLENTAVLRASWRVAHEEAVRAAAQHEELRVELRSRQTASRAASRREVRAERSRRVQERIASAGFASDATMRREEMFSRPLPVAAVSSPLLLPPPAAAAAAVAAAARGAGAGSASSLFGRPGSAHGPATSPTSSQPGSPGGGGGFLGSGGGGGGGLDTIVLQVGPAGLGWPMFDGESGELLGMEGLELDGSAPRVGWKIGRPDDPHNKSNFVFGGGFVDAGLEEEQFPAWR
jgi:hypothetical protein